MIIMSRWCSGLHGTLRRFRPWFESRSGYSQFALRVWRRHDGLRSRRARFDSSAGYFLNCSRSVLDSHARPRSSKTRFDSWREHFFTDAGARRQGHRLQPDRSGFDSHRRLFEWKVVDVVCPAACRSPGRVWRCLFREWDLIRKHRRRIA